VSAGPIATARSTRAPMSPPTARCCLSGVIVPRVVRNVMCVPLCGAVPAASTGVALIVVLPLAESTWVPALSVIVDPVGATSGTFPRDAANTAADKTAAVARPERNRRANIGA